MHAGYISSLPGPLRAHPGRLRTHSESASVHRAQLRAAQGHHQPQPLASRTVGEVWGHLCPLNITVLSPPWNKSACGAPAVAPGPKPSKAGNCVFFGKKGRVPGSAFAHDPESPRKSCSKRMRTMISQSGNTHRGRLSRKA